MLSSWSSPGNLLPKQQYGFRSYRSTNHCVSQFLSSNISLVSSQKDIEVGWYTSISKKTFDKVNYKLLIIKLSLFRFNSYFTGWKGVAILQKSMTSAGLPLLYPSCKISQRVRTGGILNKSVSVHSDLVQGYCVLE